MPLRDLVTTQNVDPSDREREIDNRERTRKRKDAGRLAPGTRDYLGEGREHRTHDQKARSDPVR